MFSSSPVLMWYATAVGFYPLPNPGLGWAGLSRDRRFAPLFWLLSMLFLGRWVLSLKPVLCPVQRNGTQGR